jgi:DNA-binding XRE family transcriptional regulator
MPFAGTVARCNAKNIGSPNLDTLKHETCLLERKAIQLVLDECEGSFARASKKIGVNRGTLYSIMNGRRKASIAVRRKLGIIKVYPAHPVMRLTELRRRIAALRFSPEILREIERELIP